MSHPSDQINNLPTELLTQVFDALNFRDRLSISTVCTRWFEILWDDRYIICHRVRLNAELLDNENFNNFKRYRSVLVKSDHFEETKNQQKLQQYFFNNESAEMLVELEIEFSVTIWNSVFGTKNELNLPNVHTLRISVPSEANMTAQMRCRIVAPKLKTFYQKSDTILKPLELLNDQIETLVVDFPEKGHFLSTALGLSFMSLRSLTLKTAESSWLLEDTDFHPGYQVVFNRLTHLKIQDKKGSFNSVYNLIIQEANNLSSLDIHGQRLSQNAFSQINQLKRLKELVLLILIDGNTVQKGLLLPSLTKLTTSVASLTPLESVPSLKQLTIGNCEWCCRPYFHETNTFVKTQLRSIGDQLESLKLVDMLMNDFFANLIGYTFVNLKSLIMEKVEVDPHKMYFLIDYLKKLKLARLSDCTLLRAIVLCTEDRHCGCDRCTYSDQDCEPEKPWTDKEDFYAMLAKKYVDCAIVAEGGRVDHCAKYITKEDYSAIEW